MKTHSPHDMQQKLTAIDQDVTVAPVLHVELLH